MKVNNQTFLVFLASRDNKGILEFRSNFVCRHRTWEVGLNWTGHMSFQTGQDRTPKFARRLNPDLHSQTFYIPNMLQNFIEIHQIETSLKKSKQTKKNLKKNQIFFKFYF